MPLVSTAEIVGSAWRAGVGVLACNVVTLEHAEAIVAGAARAGAPMILQVSHNCIDYHGGLEPIALAMLAVARHAPGPVAVHLDHARTADLVREAVALGIGSVMFDASDLDDATNVVETRRVTQECHRQGEKPLPRVAIHVGPSFVCEPMSGPAGRRLGDRGHVQGRAPCPGSKSLCRHARPHQRTGAPTSL